MGNIKYVVINGHKKCGQCGEIKPLDCFFKYNNNYRSYCKECNKKNVNAFRNNPKNKEKLKAYTKKQYEKEGAKEKKFKQNSKWLLNNKLKAVEYKGGKCIKCGYDKCINALEFHHINPLEKDINLNTRGLNRKKSFEKQKLELDKCILVCANCHREIHYQNNVTN